MAESSFLVKPRTTAAVLFLIISAAGSSGRASDIPQAADPRAEALSHFEDRVKEYVALRDRVKASLTPPSPTRNAGEIAARQHALASAVRNARASAKQGDLFTAEIGPILKEVIHQDFSLRTPSERAAALREVPAGLGLKVNDEYPKSVPLATVPPKLLAAMPRLPDGLEYRFVSHRLILHDTATDLVVDILEAAVPTR